MLLFWHVALDWDLKDYYSCKDSPCPHDPLIMLHCALQVKSTLSGTLRHLEVQACTWWILYDWSNLAQRCSAFHNTSRPMRYSILMFSWLNVKQYPPLGLQRSRTKKAKISTIGTLKVGTMCARCTVCFFSQLLEFANMLACGCSRSGVCRRTSRDRNLVIRWRWRGHPYGSTRGSVNPCS